MALISTLVFFQNRGVDMDTTFFETGGVDMDVDTTISKIVAWTWTRTRNFSKIVAWTWTWSRSFSRIVAWTWTWSQTFSKIVAWTWTWTRRETGVHVTLVLTGNRDRPTPTGMTLQSVNMSKVSVLISFSFMNGVEILEESR